MTFARLSLTAGLLVLAATGPGAAQTGTTSDLRIEWEVKNRFRLFRNEADFNRHVAAFRDDGVLAAERRLAAESDGRGWAGAVVERLCTDRGGAVLATCERDGERENYLAPADHRIALALGGSVPDGATCTWSVEDGVALPRAVTAPCEEEVRLRVAYGRTTTAGVQVAAADGSILQARAEIAVRDILIAGLGDSVAAGEGNPDRPVQLSDQGFCFREFGTGTEYYRPGRAGYRGDKSCATSRDPLTTAMTDWTRQSARWMSGPCHRSLYGHQLRAALSLAVENPHLAVTFIPLACSGATIAEGLLGPQPARECPTPGATPCPGQMPGQVQVLTKLMERASAAQSERRLDLILLTVGANDLLFSKLVADVIVKPGAERVMFERGGVIASTADADAVLQTGLPPNFVKLRAALKPLVGGALARVVFVSYGNPALAAPDVPCPGGRDGFDIHPAFDADPKRLDGTAAFVSQRLLPRLKELAQCGPGVLCNGDSDRMTFVDGHQRAFASHGFCAHADDDPDFDRACFARDGTSFRARAADAAVDPMACARSARNYRPYASRARWVRTANDSYLTAMTYPISLPAVMQPGDIHDAAWAVMAAVYGGAIHPTAEGQAAMADAALGAMRAGLGLDPLPAVKSAPLPAPPALPP